MLGIDLAIGRPSVKPSLGEACAMRDSNRRGFLATSAAAAALPLLP
jgi:TAT (twin-arginine translocation) pathway signal sequence